MKPLKFEPILAHCGSKHNFASYIYFLPIREAFKRFFPSYLGTHPSRASEKRKVAESIMKCKTGS